MIIGIMVIVSCDVFAQVSTNPQDMFYTYAENWYLKGYVSRLPQLRPYALTTIKEILDTVMQVGSESDIAIAADYYNQIKEGKAHIELSGTYSRKQEYDIDDKDSRGTNQYAICPFFVGDLDLDKGLSVGYNLGVFAANNDDRTILPQNTNSLYDTVSDPWTIGSLEANIDLNTNVAFTKEAFTVQGGINRTGYGPFLGDDLALSDSSFHAPNFSATYNAEKWSYTQTYIMLGSTVNNGDSSKLDKSNMGKNFSFHSLRFELHKMLAFSVYESEVFKNTNLAYVLPAPFMAIQGMGDSVDNGQMGVLLEFHPGYGFEWANSVFSDDMALDELVKGNFDSKIRLGFETGLLYAPNVAWCRQLSLNYTLVTPYNYAHWSYDDDTTAIFTDKTYNYLNYVNHGVSVGATIPPNSDRIMFRASFTPVKRLSATVFTSFVRHGNAYESLSDSEKEKVYLTNYYSHTNSYVYVNTTTGAVYAPASGAQYDSTDVNGAETAGYTKIVTNGGDVYSTDGSLYTQQMFIGGHHIDTAWDYLNFLSQDNIMTIYQLGFALSYQLPRMVVGDITFNFGYTFEYIHNNGVQNAMLSGSTGNGSWQTAYNEWEHKLHETINQYMSIGVKISY